MGRVSKWSGRKDRRKDGEVIRKKKGKDKRKIKKDKKSERLSCGQKKKV
jgi:hypothetical protein